METLVFGVRALDSLTLAAVAATLALVASIVSLVPAYRALRIESVKVLRGVCRGITPAGRPGGIEHPQWRWSGQAASGSIPNRSFTAVRSICLHPR